MLLILLIFVVLYSLMNRSKREPFNNDAKCLSKLITAPQPSPTFRINTMDPVFAQNPCPIPPKLGPKVLLYPERNYRGIPLRLQVGEYTLKDLYKEAETQIDYPWPNQFTGLFMFGSCKIPHPYKVQFFCLDNFQETPTEQSITLTNDYCNSTDINNPELFFFPPPWKCQNNSLCSDHDQIFCGVNQNTSLCPKNNGILGHRTISIRVMVK